MLLTNAVPSSATPPPPSSSPLDALKRAIAPKVEAPPAQAVASEPAVAPDAPVADASFAQKLLGNVGSKQQRYLENLQVIGLVSQEFTQRISQVGSHVWSMLRGTAPEVPQA
jgi:hypothetical protein